MTSEVDQLREEVKQLRELVNLSVLNNPNAKIKLKKWCQLTGDTPAAVYGRIRETNQWVCGHHVVKDGKMLWVNVHEAWKWLDKNKRQKQVTA